MEKISNLADKLEWLQRDFDALKAALEKERKRIDEIQCKVEDIASIPLIERKLYGDD